MSVIIQNIDTNLRATGEHKYVLRINQKVIAYFKHDRERGLAECLRRAAEAVEDRERQENLDARALIEAVAAAMHSERK